MNKDEKQLRSIFTDNRTRQKTPRNKHHYPCQAVSGITKNLSPKADTTLLPVISLAGRKTIPKSRANVKKNHTLTRVKTIS